MMKFRHIRHATMIIELNGCRLLVDPMLSKAQTLDPIPGVANTSANPLVELPFDPVPLADAVLVTHTHVDHFDQAAMNLLPHSIPLFCQPGDQAVIEAAGFNCVQPVETWLDWNGLKMIRTGGQHGTGKIAVKMGPVSGFILQARGEPTVYIAGDTVWCQEIRTAIETYHPQVIVVFAGGARFAAGDPITMDKEDIQQVCRYAPAARIIAVHLEAWNHCTLTRKELESYLQQSALADRVYIPGDGEELAF